MRRLVAGSALLLHALPAAARDLWVDHDSMGGACDDARAASEVSEDAPWCTLGAAGIGAEPGDTVHVRRGDYSEPQACAECAGDVVLQLLRSGEEDAWIRFVAAEGERPVLRARSSARDGIRLAATGGDPPRFVEIEGLQVAGALGTCVFLDGATDVVLRDLDVSGCETGALELRRTERVTVETSVIHDNSLGPTSAIALVECGAGHVVRRNHVYRNDDDHDERDTEGHGVAVRGCGAAGDVLVENNAIDANEGSCILVRESDGVVVRHNTCYRNGVREGAGEISLHGQAWSVHNNIAVPRDLRMALDAFDSIEYPVDRGTLEEGSNVFWSPTRSEVVGWFGTESNVVDYRDANPGLGLRSVQQNPILAEPDQRDFMPNPGSPALDSGDPDRAAEVDLRGLPRPADADGDGEPIVDRGAFERGAEGGDSDTDVDTDADSDSDVVPPPDRTDDGGCSCRTSGSSAAIFLWLALPLAFRRRRR